MSRAWGFVNECFSGIVSRQNFPDEEQKTVADLVEGSGENLVSAHELKSNPNK